jgi:hypothetical protein
MVLHQALFQTRETQQHNAGQTSVGMPALIIMLMGLGVFFIAQQAWAASAQHIETESSQKGADAVEADLGGELLREHRDACNPNGRSGSGCHLRFGPTKAFVGCAEQYR